MIQLNIINHELEIMFNNPVVQTSSRLNLSKHRIYYVSKFFIKNQFSSFVVADPRIAASTSGKDDSTGKGCCVDRIK